MGVQGTGIIVFDFGNTLTADWAWSNCFHLDLSNNPWPITSLNDQLKTWKLLHIMPGPIQPTRGHRLHTEQSLKWSELTWGGTQ